MIRDGRTTKAAADLTRKEMKGPDHFQVAATDAAEWLSKNRRVAGAALAVAAVFVVAGLVVHGYLTSGRSAAGGELYRALDAADGVVSTVPLPGVDRPVFASEAERQKAVIAAADLTRRQHPGTRAAVTAALASGEAHLRLEEWDAAMGDLNAYLAAAPADDALRFAGLDGLARAQEGKGDLAAAAATFERAGREASFYRDRAELERARVLARAGKDDEAKKLLAAFPGEFKDSPLKGEAAERLAALGGK